MKLTIEPTLEIYDAPINGVKVPVRIWQGVSEGGVAVEVYVLSVTPKRAEDLAALRREVPEFMRLSRETYRIDVEPKEND